MEENQESEENASKGAGHEMVNIFSFFHFNLFE